MNPIPVSQGRATGRALALIAAAAGLWLLAAPAAAAERGGRPQIDPVRLLDRLSWGATSSDMRHIAQVGVDRYIEAQLNPKPAALPEPVERQLAAMTLSRRPLAELVPELERQRKTVQAMTMSADKDVATAAYQKAATAIYREFASRMLLRSLYSPNQLQEQMAWFWANHFSVFQGKSGVMLGDYVDAAIRPRALGRFRDLLGATLRHPAMLRYLDNEQNVAGRINENYARELLELHTLGVDGGYSQQDVQELARVLTGVGINLTADAPKLKPELQPQYLRDGLFEFNPARHDYGDKMLLGQPLRGRGLAEVDEALDRLARHPATARFVCRKMARYFLAGDPSPALVEQMAATFLRSDGRIADTLRVLFRSPEFARSLGKQFKDPVHYVISAVRLAYDGRPILNTDPMIQWLIRMGQPLHGRQTPDGYPLYESAWTSPGQMTTRFEIASAIGNGRAGLFRGEEAQAAEASAVPQLSGSLYFERMRDHLGEATRKALEQAGSPQEWNVFLLSSPEFMDR